MKLKRELELVDGLRKDSKGESIISNKLLNEIHSSTNLNNEMDAVMNDER